MKERKWFVEYKNSGGFGEGMEVEGASEQDAILSVVDFLREDCDFITQLINVEEIFDEEEDPVWSIKGGEVLEQEYQDTLNDAFLNMVNEDGMTLKQVWNKEIEEEKNK